MSDLLVIAFDNEANGFELRTALEMVTQPGGPSRRALLGMAGAAAAPWRARR